MEIFLLLVVIALLVIFHSIKNSKISLLETKLNAIEKSLKFIQQQQVQKVETKTTDNTEIKTPARVNPAITHLSPPPVISKPVITEEHKQTLPVKETQQESMPASVVPLIPSEIKITQPEQKPIAVTPKPVAPEQSWYDTFRKNNPDLEKFIGENIVSKIGVAILVIGIAFFVKYAIDQNWINEIARVGIGILCGGIVLGFAHRLHKKFKAFSSVLVAGGIAIFYFTIGIGFHQYHLFSQTTAFVIMFLITAFSVFISIVYDRIELAALSLIGGFATPFMVSTGQGNYMVLFTYVLILDIGMLVLAYLRKWNLINIMAYCFTMLLYFVWLQTKVIGEPNPPYKGAMVFAAIFYVVFVLMNIINNIKEKRKFGTLELSILISNTFLFYGAGMQILKYAHPELQGLFSLLMAIFNLVCSWLLYKKFKADSKLVYLMIGLTLTFITLIAPVQLHGNYITIFWALEAVLLIWLAQKSNIVLYRLVSVIITSLMGISLLMDWIHIYTYHQEVPLNILLNKGFMTSLFSSLSLLAISLLLKKETETVTYLGIPFNPKHYSSFLKIGFIVLLYLTGLFELIYQLNQFIYSSVAISIVIGSYHLLYCIALHLVGQQLKNNGLKAAMPVIHYINAILFVVILASLPIMDFKENMVIPNRGYVGFIFHYISLGCFVFMMYKIYPLTKQQESFIHNTHTMQTIFVAIAITYIISLELLLHVYQFTIHSVVSDSEVSGKWPEYASTRLHVIKIGFPILWGLLAFLFLFIGMKKRNKILRILSLVLLGITLLKLFIYDIQDASEAGKIVAFIILGIVLLIISFMYQKIKALLLDDKKTETTN